jgi:hypothetical protein
VVSVGEAVDRVRTEIDALRQAITKLVVEIPYDD